MLYKDAHKTFVSVMTDKSIIRVMLLRPKSDSPAELTESSFWSFTMHTRQVPCKLTTSL